MKKSAKKAQARDTKLAVVPAPQNLTPSAPPGSPAHLIQSIAAAAANPNVDIAKMKELYAMHSDMKAKEAEVAFNAAFARAQAKMDVIVAVNDNEQTKSKFAKLADIDKILKPIYTAEGFSMSFGTGKADRENDIRITCRLSHAAGHSRDYYIDLPRDEAGFKGTANKTPVHGAGSTNSYGRRYLTCMIWNIATSDDKDGNGSKDAGLSEKSVADHLAAISGAHDERSVKVAYGAAFNAADAVNDKPSKKKFIDAKDKRKKELGIE